MTQNRPTLNVTADRKVEQAWSINLSEVALVTKIVGNFLFLHKSQFRFFAHVEIS